jgi:hypothetical protein
MRVHIALAVLCTAGLALPASAQSVASAAGPLRFGVMAGLNSSTIGGSDADDADRRTAFVGGVYVVKPLSGGLAFRPELLLSQKGAEQSLVEEGVSVKGTLRLTYIDVPLLLQLEGTSASGVRPHAYAGPSIGFKTGCSVKGSGGGFSVSASCSEFGSDVKTVDVGGVIGAGIGFPVGGLSATIGARYQHGFTDIAEDVKVQNRVIAFYASLELGKR